MGRPSKAGAEGALGDRVKELRRKKGWTLDELSEACVVEELQTAIGEARLLVRIECDMVRA